MLKLIKHDFLGAFRSLVRINLLVLAASVLSGFVLKDIFASLIQYDGPTPSAVQTLLLSALLMFMFCAAIFIFVWIIRNFNSSMYHKEGYLTLTLPFSTSEILLSKLIVAMLAVIISSIVFSLGIFLIVYIVTGYFNSEIYKWLIRIFSELFTYDLFKFLLTVLSWIVNNGVMLLMFFSTCTLVKMKWAKKHAYLWGVIIFLALWTVNGIVLESLVYPLVGVVFFPNSGNPANLMQSVLISNTSWAIISSEWVKITTALTIYYTLIGIGLFYLNVYVINNHIEID